MRYNSLISELKFKAIKSSGSGGQHVNKVASKIELCFDINNSNILTKEDKIQICSFLKARLTNDNLLILKCGLSRSQHKNKDLVVKRFLDLINTALIVPKKRIKTKIPKAVIKKRLKNKAHNTLKKQSRKKPTLD